MRCLLRFYLEVPLGPIDPVEELAQASALGGVDRLHKPDTALQVGTEAWMSLSILASRAEPHAIRQSGLQSFIVGSHDIDTLVDDDARQMLSDTLAHDARLTMIRGETLFEQNRRNIGRETVGATCEIITTREGKIVGVARVCGA